VRQRVVESTVFVLFFAILHTVVNYWWKASFPVGLAVEGIVLVIAFNFFPTKDLAAELRPLVDYLRELASGEFFLALPPAPPRLQGLFGAVGAAHRFSRNLLASTAKLSIALHSTAQEIADSATETEASAAQIAAAFAEVAQNNQVQANKAAEVTKATQTLSVLIADVSQRIAALARRTDEASAAAEQGMSSTKSMLEAMARVRSESQDTEQAVQRLEEQSQGIGQILEAISEIAAQTNLLALNAAIEAARAGEAGRGFAVVADEVKKLATSAQQSVEQIRFMLDHILAGIKEVHSAAELTARETETSLRTAEQSGQAFQGVAEAGGDIAANLRQVNSIAQEMQRGTQHLLADIEAISVAAEATAASSEEIAAGVDDQSRNLSILAKAIASLTEQADQMQQWVAEKGMERTMWNRSQRLAAIDAVEELTPARLQALTAELGVDDIYLTDPQGVCIMGTQDIIGMCIFDIYPDYRQAATGERDYVVTPIMKRVEDGKLYKFMVSRRPNGKGLLDISFSAERILALASEG